MTTGWKETTEQHSLEILGINDAEERTYRWLLAHPRSAVSEVARALGGTPNKAQRLLDAIESKGLATRTPERPRRYIPASPDIALKALALRRQEDLQRVEETIQVMQKQLVNQRHDEQEHMVELITSHEVGRQTFEHMQRAASKEVVGLVRSPVLISRTDIPHERDQLAQREAQGRGVRYRSIVDAEFFDIPGAVEGIRHDINAGEEVRVSSSLPFKLLMADRRMALIPLAPDKTSKPFVLLVRSSPLLDALYTLFELLWAQASPISLTPEAMLKTGAPPALLTDEGTRLMSLLAAGLNDKRLAREIRRPKPWPLRPLPPVISSASLR